MTSRRLGEPSLSEVLLALADSGPHPEAARQLGLSPERLDGILRENAAPRPSAPPVAAASGLAHAVLEVFSDGAARGNPGPAGAGAVLRTPDGKVVARVGRFLGVQTNNVAEYEGLLLGLKKASDLGAREVRIFADSLLAISQLRGTWRIKHEGLKPLHTRAKEMLRRFDRVTLQHVPRAMNKEADEMSNRAIDEKME